jgi:hypothetical protein
MKIRSFIKLLLTVSALSQICCTENLVNAPAEFPGGNCVGVLRDSTGTPVQGASVLLIPEEHVPVMIGSAQNNYDTATTDNKGQYGFSISKNGIYNLLANGNSGYTIHKSIRLSTNAQIELTGDTLLAPGSISGCVRLQSMEDNQTAVILFVGTNIYAIPSDTTGKFVVSHLAMGEYRLRLMTTKNGFAVVETTVIVASGKCTNLPVVELQKQHLPAVDNFSVEYDPAMMKVTLAWGSLDSADISKYVLYCNREKNLSPVTVVDSSMRKMTLDILTFPLDTYTYQIAAVGKDGMQGPTTKGNSFVNESTIKIMEISIGTKIECNTVLSGITAGKNGNLYIYNQKTISKIDSNGMLLNTKSFPAGALSKGQRMLTDNDGNLYCIFYRNTSNTGDSSEDFPDSPLVSHNTSIFKYDQNMNFVKKLMFKENMGITNITFAIGGDGSIIVYYTSNGLKGFSDWKDVDDTTFVEVYGSDFVLRSSYKIANEIREIENSLIYNDTIIAQVRINEWDNFQIIYFDNQFTKIRSVSTFDFLDAFTTTQVKSSLQMCSPNLWSIYAYTPDEKFSYLLFFNNKNEVVSRMLYNDFAYNTHYGFNGIFYEFSNSKENVILKYSSALQ